MKPVWLSVSLCCALMGCTPLSLVTPASETSSLTKEIPENSRLQIEGQILNAESVQDFLIQKLKGQVAKTPTGDWRGALPQGLERTPELRIQEITLADTGQSVMGSGAPAALVPDFQGQTVELVLKGHFATRQDKALKLKTFLFTLEVPLLHQSLAPGSTEPASRVVLDDAILLTPISVSETEIRVRLDTRGLLDLMLAGTHKLSLIHNRYYTDALIKVAKPAAAPGNLQPSIRSVEVVRDEHNQPRFLKCQIENAMTQPKFSYAAIDGVFGFGYQTQVIEGESDLSWEVLIHIPEPATFNPSMPHTLTYSTPFGTAYRAF